MIVRVLSTVKRLEYLLLHPKLMKQNVNHQVEHLKLWVILNQLVSRLMTQLFERLKCLCKTKIIIFVTKHYFQCSYTIFEKYSLLCAVSEIGGPQWALKELPNETAWTSASYVCIRQEMEWRALMKAISLDIPLHATMRKRYIWLWGNYIQECIMCKNSSMKTELV